MLVTMLNLWLLCLACLSAAAYEFQQIPLVDNTGANDSYDDLLEWIQRQEMISLDKILDNIAPGGKHTKDAVLGTVLASPSKEHPDYHYQWTRDSAITIGTLVDIYGRNTTSSEHKDRIQAIVKAYTKLSLQLQHTSNPSGNFEDLEGLGEPKFNADGSAFTGPWGRPQRDGPALRAITLMSWLKAYNASQPVLWDEETRNCVYGNLYKPELPAGSVIKADLEYVARYWNHSGFDIWEEVQGRHCFTAMVQLRALREGADIADAFGDNGAAAWYRQQASAVNDLLPQFWNQDKGHLMATIKNDRSGLDCSVLLGALHGVTSQASNQFDNVLAPYSDEILVSMLYLIRDQRKRFPINEIDMEVPQFCGKDIFGAGIGRYPEDIYDGYDNSERGGNPWFICTATIAEIMFRTLAHLASRQSTTITETGLEFWRSVLPDWELKAGDNIEKSSWTWEFMAGCLFQASNSFLMVIRNHSSYGGSLSEQFDRETGVERGAPDLTWSYGSFLQAITAMRTLHRTDEHARHLATAPFAAFKDAGHELK